MYVPSHAKEMFVIREEGGEGEKCSKDTGERTRYHD